MSDDLIGAIEKQSEILAAILERMESPKLGLHSDPIGSIVIYANRRNGGLWYRLDGKTPIVIEQTALTGYLTKIEIVDITRDGEVVSKLRITMECERLYLLECGANTTFAKGFLLAIATMAEELKDGLKKPISIVPQAGTREGKAENSALLCQVFVGGKLVLTSSKYSDVDWDAIARLAIENVGTGSIPTPSPSSLSDSIRKMLNDAVKRFGLNRKIVEDIAHGEALDVQSLNYTQANHLIEKMEEYAIIYRGITP